jgi:hypothetical protein
LVAAVFRVLAVLIFLAPACLAAQEKTGTKNGFELRPGTARILLLEPSVRVGEQSTGGMFEPNADWTDQARENIERELAKIQDGLGNEVVRLDFDGSPRTEPLQRYHALFGAVAGSVIEYQFFKGNRLPTKKREDDFLWTVGPQIHDLAVLKGFDYILLLRTRDAYGSTGRKILQVFGALGGISVTSGEHIGYAGLIDVKTGDLVWLNADLQMGGDVRTAEGAEKRVGQLLEGFPGRGGPGRGGK